MKYRDFLQKLKMIQQKYKIFNSFKSDFNIFKIISNPYDEVNLHSKFIAEVLNNKKYGKVFLKLFLDELEINYEKEIIDNIFVETERTFNGNRIDILIQLKNKNYKKAIVIENKIYAGDQHKQLERYFYSVKRLGYKEEEIEIIYLTLDGSEASEYSLGDLPKDIRERIKNISYEDDIISWIKNCVKESATIPEIREILIQYKELLEDMTVKKDENMINEIKNEILNDLENFEISTSIVEALEESKIELQFKFWEKLKGKLDENNRIVFMDNEDLLGSENRNYSKEIIRDYYKKSKNNKNYGLTYFVKNIDGLGNVYIQLEIYYNIGVGIRKSIEKLNKGEKYDKLISILKENNYYEVDTKWWLGWIYLNYNELDRINFHEFDARLAKILIDKNEFDNFIDSLAKQIDEVVDIVLSI